MDERSDLLKEAIADAKAVKETALANAKIALEEAFAPRIQSMLSTKLSEEMYEEEDMDNEEKAMAPVDEEMEDMDMADMGDETTEEPIGDELGDTITVNGETYEKVDDMEDEMEEPAGDDMGDDMDTMEGMKMHDEDLELEAIIRELEEDLNEEDLNEEMENDKDDAEG